MRTFIRTRLRHHLEPLIPIYRFARSAVASWEYGREAILSGSHGNAEIARLIREGIPASVNRIGVVELDALRKWESSKRRLTNLSGILEFRLLNANAGVFPLERNVLEEFFSVYRSSLEDSTHLTVIKNIGEGRLIRSLSSGPITFDVLGIDPFYWEKPWISELLDKKVLIVSPFSRTIESQYMRREAIWKGLPGFLPRFDLKTIRVPLSGGVTQPEHRSWPAALNDLLTQVGECDYDVLIAGAGGFAPPLVAHAKKAGKVGINLGGSTQILFGVRGARWDAHPVISKWFNESWVRPSSEETPARANLIEGACYW